MKYTETEQQIVAHAATIFNILVRKLDLSHKDDWNLIAHKAFDIAESFERAFQERVQKKRQLNLTLPLTNPISPRH